MSVEVKTSTRRHVRRGLNEYELDEATTIDTVEVWIDGIKFATDVPSAEVGRALVVQIARTLKVSS